VHRDDIGKRVGAGSVDEIRMMQSSQAVVNCIRTRSGQLHKMR
jgi:hypothetical protein